MKSSSLSKAQKAFYQNLKKSLRSPSAFVFGSTAATNDIVVLDITKDVQLFKIVPPWDVSRVPAWLDNLRRIYVLSWYRANYTLVYVDSNFEEIKRETYALK